MTAAAPRAVVITVSDRAAAGEYPDRSGPLLVELAAQAGCVVDGPRVVPDGLPVAEALRRALAEGYDVALTTGGTGLAPRDRTPEATRPLLEYEIPGLAEALRAAGRDKGVPTAVLSRGLAGVARRGGHRMLVVNLPGSVGGVRDGMAVLGPILAAMNGGFFSADSARNVLDGKGVTEMIAPLTVNMQLTLTEPFLTKAEFLHDPPAFVVLRADIGLDAVQPHREKGMVDRQRDCGRHHTPPGIVAVNPIADLRRPRRPPRDRPHRDLADEPALPGDSPRHRDPLPGLPADGLHHGHIGEQAVALRRKFWMGGLPRAQPFTVAGPGLAQRRSITQPERTQDNLPLR